MNLELVRVPHGLSPVDDESVEAIKKLPLGEVIITEWKPRRNIGHHRKLFSMLRAVLPHTKYKSEKELLDAIKVDSGHCTTHVTPGGIEFKTPDSIAFHALDQKGFEAFYSASIDVCLTLVGEEALNEILSYL